LVSGWVRHPLELQCARVSAQAAIRALCGRKPAHAVTDRDCWATAAVRTTELNSERARSPSAKRVRCCAGSVIRCANNALRARAARNSARKGFAEKNGPRPVGRGPTPQHTCRGEAVRWCPVSMACPPSAASRGPRLRFWFSSHLYQGSRYSFQRGRQRHAMPPVAPGQVHDSQGGQGGVGLAGERLQCPAARKRAT
jgi:hypothetical protein